MSMLLGFLGLFLVFAFLATVTQTYASPATITWTPASLADGSYDGSAKVDNGINKYVDVLVGGFITTGTSPTATNLILLYLYATWDNGTTFTAGVSGSDGGTPDAGEEQNLVLVTVIEVDGTNDHRYEYGPFSVASFFGGRMPEEWGLVVKNNSGAALNSAAGNHEAKYTGIEYDVT